MIGAWGLVLKLTSGQKIVIFPSILEKKVNLTIIMNTVLVLY